MESFTTQFVRQSDGSEGSDGSSGEASAAAASSLSLGDWLLGGGIILGGIFLAFVASKVVKNLVARKNEMIATLISRVVASVVFIVGLVIGLTTVGVPIAPLAGGLSIVGLAIAFALKSILNNLLSGVMIQIRQPFQIGHLVKLDGFFGKIEAISLRTVDMTTVDGEYVMIPAGTVVENAIENWTTNGERREEVLIGIDYDADIDTAVEGIASAVRSLDVVLDREVKVIIDELAGSSVNLRILAWHDVEDHFLDVSHAMAKTAKEWCDQNDVALPCPIRELVVRDAGALVSDARSTSENRE